MSVVATAIGVGGGALLSGTASGIVAGGLIGSGVASGLAAKEGAEAQAEAALQAGETSYAATMEQIAAQEKALDKILAANKESSEAQVALNQPWQEAGLAALENIRTRIDQGDTFDFEADPGYQFRKNEMTKAIERRAAVRGRTNSPATDKEIARYVGNLASQEYGNAFNRYQRQRAANLAPEFDLANIGRGAAASNVAAVGAAGQTGTSAISRTAGNVSNLATGGANALSQAYLNRGAALNQGYAGQAASYNQGFENVLQLGADAGWF